MSTVQKIEQAAMKLPRKRRAELAGRLLESLETKRSREIAAAWASEAERRVDAFDAGILKSLSAETVFKYRGRPAR